MRVKSVTKTAALVDGAVKHTVQGMLAMSQGNPLSAALISNTCGLAS